MNYENLEQLQKAWMSGELDYTGEITVADVPYHLHATSKESFSELLVDGATPYLTYVTSSTHKREARDAGLRQAILLIWKSEDSVIRPQDVRTSSIQGILNTLKEDVQTIGEVAILKIELPSGAGAVKGKVDTGAEICSLHADKYEVIGDQVKFVNKHLSNNVITVPIVQRQAVKSADGGVEYRPVVEFNVEINGKRVNKVAFNLNDRSEMEYPVLIGINLLERTNFLVDPKQNDDDHKKMEGVEEDEWLTEEQLAELNPVITEDEIEQLSEEIKQKHVEQIYEAVKNSDISFADLLRYVRADARSAVDDIEY